MRPTPYAALAAILLTIALSPASSIAQTNLGLFESQTDIGDVAHPGKVAYDPAAQTYSITGGGENMWFAVDALHYTWKKMEGDVSLAADIRFIGTGGNAHRKACLIIRQDLSPDSAYADAVIHGDGLTSIQYRQTKGADTSEIQANISAPRRILIEKRGHYVTMSYAANDGVMRRAGGAFRIDFDEPFYLGLGVCAHDNNVTETAVFSHVELKQLSPLSADAPRALYSTIETIPIPSGDRRVVFTTAGRIASPRWTDAGSIDFERDGKTYRVPLTGGDPQLTRSRKPDTRDDAAVPSPDGSTLYYAAPAGGVTHIFKRNPDGSGATQLTHDNHSDWFPQPSPDGRYLAFLSADPALTQPPADRDVTLRLLDLQTDQVRTLARLLGGRGTLDGPSFSPDSRRLAYISYYLGPSE